MSGRDVTGHGLGHLPHLPHKQVTQIFVRRRALRPEFDSFVEANDRFVESLALMKCIAQVYMNTSAVLPEGKGSLIVSNGVVQFGGIESYQVCRQAEDNPEVVRLMALGLPP